MIQTRKQQSLIEALQAVDNIAKVSVQEIQSDLINNNDIGNGNGRRKGKIKNKLKQWNERRKEYVLQRKYSNSLSGVNRTFNLITKRIGEKRRKKEEKKKEKHRRKQNNCIYLCFRNV